jgi:hypothetical protein
MLQNIRTRMGRNSELERALFETDPTRRGHMRLKDQFTDALALTEEFGRVSGNNSELFQNVFAGGGHGNPQSLLANQRRILGNLLNTDAEGKTGVRRTRELMRGSSLTEADLQRGAAVFGGDTQAELAGNRARRGLELTDPAVVGAVSSLDRFAAEHPMLAPAVSALGSMGGEKLMRWVGGRMGGAMTPKAIGTGGALRYLGPVGAFIGTLFGTDSLSGQNIAAGRARAGSREAVDGGSDAAMIRAHREAGGGSAGQEAAIRAMQDAVERGVQRGMQQARVTATLETHDAAHASSQGASSRSVPR